MQGLKNFSAEWKVKNTKDRIYMAMGAMFLLLAVIGVLLPLVPQVPFAVASAYFFSKGSPKIHRWMRQNHYFGDQIKEWEDYKIIRPRMKLIATISMCVGAIIGHYALPQRGAIVLDVIFLISIVFVLTRRSNH